MNQGVIKNIKVVAFDFDGVIVDSNRLKRDVWFSIFHPTLGITEEEIQESLDRVRETRFDILRDIFLKKNIAAGESLERLVNEHADKFQTYVQNGMKLMPRAKETLAVLSGQFPLYINSATPEEPLRESVRHLGISKHFKGVFGRPATKTEILNSILKLESAKPQELLFIGDGENDKDAAKSIGCPFIGVVNEFNEWDESVDVPLIKNLSGLLKYVPDLV